MNFEEKYNEILEWARKNKAKLNGVPIEEVLPELAESEDEKIRKKLYEFISDTLGDELDGYDISKGDALAYLEKQKEQKPAESISQLTVQGKGVYKICPRCKERMVRDDSMVYTSMPPQYRYECPKCGESECDTVMYDNPEMEKQKPAEFTPNQFDGITYGMSGYSTDKPAEWSEEDEDMLNSCISSIEEAKENRYAYRETDGDTSYDHEISWLKSLRPSWKPSEEQLPGIEDPGIPGKDFIPVDWVDACEKYGKWKIVKVK